MTGLTLGADAGAEYSGLSLTFVVHLEAQQNAAALLGDAWGLASESALYKALENFCG
jgi:hypothetical protein